MLVEINLLAEKHKKDVTYLLIIAIVVVILLMTFMFTYAYVNNVESDIEEINTEMQIASMEAVRMQEEINEKTSSDKENLSDAITSLENELYPVSLLLKNLVSLLPEEGYFLNFDYSLSGVVTFDAQFDQIEAAAAYSRFLQDSEIVRTVSLTQIYTDSLELDTEEVDYLPRYIGRFTLQINQTALNELRERE